MTDRGTGRTTAQMLAAAKGAYFVWCNGTSLGYAKALADFLGRADLHIVSSVWAFQERGLHLRGVCQQVIVDHAFIPDARTRDGYREAFARLMIKAA